MKIPLKNPVTILVELLHYKGTGQGYLQVNTN